MRILADNKKTAQEIQDRILRKMPTEKKLEMLDGFFRFAKELNRLPRFKKTGLEIYQKVGEDSIY